jgi:hypothetical protein
MMFCWRIRRIRTGKKIAVPAFFLAEWKMDVQRIGRALIGHTKQYEALPAQRECRHREHHKVLLG